MWAESARYDSPPAQTTLTLLSRTPHHRPLLTKSSSSHVVHNCSFDVELRWMVFFFFFGSNHLKPTDLTLSCAVRSKIGSFTCVAR